MCVANTIIHHWFSACRRCHSRWQPSALHVIVVASTPGHTVGTRKAGAVRCKLHLASCFLVYRFPACFWLLCPLWLVNCQRIKKNTPNKALFMYFIFWIDGKWCLPRHLPVDPYREVILCQKPTLIGNSAKTFKFLPPWSLENMFFKILQGLW